MPLLQAGVSIDGWFDRHLSEPELVRALHAAGLVDRYALQVYPIVLGSGTRLFGKGDRVDLTLERSIPTTTGVLITEYAVNH